MRVSNHAIRRYQERIENCSGEQARILIAELAERGDPAQVEDWDKFSTRPRNAAKHIVYGDVMLVILIADQLVTTVLTPKGE